MPATPLPLISVIIPVYNAAGFLGRAVESAQNQSYPNLEILIIDDCSTDDTLDVANRFAKSDSRIRVFQQQQNGGPSAARNRALTEAKGEWVAILDADDAYTPERLSRLIETARKASADMVADNIRLYDAHAQKESGIAFQWGKEAHIPLTLEYLLKNDTVGRGNPLGWIKPMIKRDFLEKHGLKYQTNLRHAEDFYLYVEILLQHGKAVLLNEAHYIYTTRVGAISGKSSGQSQTKTDLSSIISACDTLLTQFQSRLSPTEAALLTQRKKDCSRYQGVLNLRYNLRHKKLASFFLTALRHPLSVLDFCRSMASAILRRLK